MIFSYTMYLLMTILYLQHKIAFAFNEKTVRRIRDYLRDHAGEIIWEVNESGFVRTRFPKELVDLQDPMFDGLNKSAISVRSNFWYNVKPDLKDAAAHDHPNGFISYVVSNGYMHAVYHLMKEYPNIDHCVQFYEKLNTDNHCAQSVVIHKQNKSIEYKGTVMLDLVEIHQAKTADIAIFDDKAVHRILSYQSNTLTLNIVREDGKYYTRIFRFPEDKTNVKNTRKVLSGHDASPITKKAIQLYTVHLENLDKFQDREKTIVRYELNKFSFLNQNNHQTCSNNHNEMYNP